MTTENTRPTADLEAYAQRLYAALDVAVPDDRDPFWYGTATCEPGWSAAMHGRLGDRDDVVATTAEQTGGCCWVLFAVHRSGLVLSCSLDGWSVTRPATTDPGDHWTEGVYRAWEAETDGTVVFVGWHDHRETRRWHEWARTLNGLLIDREGLDGFDDDVLIDVVARYDVGRLFDRWVTASDAAGIIGGLAYHEGPQLAGPPPDDATIDRYWNLVVCDDDANQTCRVCGRDVDHPAPFCSDACAEEAYYA